MVKIAAKTKPKLTTIMVRNMDLSLKNRFKALCAHYDNTPMQQRLIELIEADVESYEASCLPNGTPGSR